MRFCSANCQFDSNPVRSRAIYCPLLTRDNARRIWTSTPQNRTTTNLLSSSKIVILFVVGQFIARSDRWTCDESH